MTEHQEIEELLGAYALDAVEADEAERIEDHLRTCPRCRAEVEEHREVASLLVGGGGQASEGLWDSIVAELGDTPPPVPIEVAFGKRRARRGSGRVLAGLAAAAVVLLLALLGGLVLDQRSELQDVQAMVAANDELAALFADVDSQVVDLEGEDDLAVRAVVGGDGDGLLLGDALPDLPSHQTYQLWGADGPTMISLGVLGHDPSQAEFHVEYPVAALAVTAEPAGGSPAPTTDPLVSGVLT